MNLIDNRIRAVINDFNMFNCEISPPCGGITHPGTRVVVGLSGGADSIVLIHYLKYALTCNVFACHINHNLRGAESVRDMEFVKEFCSKHSIELFIKEADVFSYAKENFLTVEESGREIRYDFFAQIKKKTDACYIATAHTLSDNAETLLLNLTRGTALSGLCGIPAVRDDIIRPLLYCTRADIEDYCKENKLDYVTDSTNSQDIYSRNNIRNNVIPVLKQINPAFEAAVLRTVATLKNDNSYLEKLSQELFLRCMADDNSCNKYNITPLKNMDIALLHRVAGKILEECGVAKSYDLICRLCGIISLSKGKINIAKNVYAEVSQSILTVGEEKKPLPYFEDELLLGKYTTKSGEIYMISKYDIQTFDYTKKVYKNLLYIVLDYDKIVGKIFIRQKKAADEINFVNRNGNKKLKKLFIDAKLTPFEKSKTLVLADEASIIGVYGFGVAQRVAIDENTKTILRIEKLK